MSFVVKSISSTQYKIKVVNRDSALLVAPGSSPVVAATSISDLSNYSKTVDMLANVAAAYSNSVTYASLVSSNAYSNAVAYANSIVSNITITSISDVEQPGVTPENNSTLVYSTAENKYVVKQIDLDGGNF